MTTADGIDRNSPPPDTDLADSLSRLSQHRKIVLLTDGYATPFLAKTAVSLLRYRTEDIVAVIDNSSDAKTAENLLAVGDDVPVVSGLDKVTEADAVYIGIAPPGGKLPPEWRPEINAAIDARLDVVSGLHDFLIEDAEFHRRAAERGSRLIDVRRNRFKETATGDAFRQGCIRLHTVGHDCTVGKMAVSFEVQRGLARRQQDTAFLATGQTGIMISGNGVPIDCVVADFVNGAAEQLVRQHQQHEFLLIEGQGSLSHPAFSAVTLGLLHGAAPDGLIFCYEAGRDYVKGLDQIPIPPLGQLMDAYRTLANLRHPCKVIGIAANTRSLSAEQADAEIHRVQAEFGLPTCDVYRQGADVLVDAAEQLRQEVLAS